MGYAIKLLKGNGSGGGGSAYNEDTDEYSFVCGAFHYTRVFPAIMYPDINYPGVQYNTHYEGATYVANIMLDRYLHIASGKYMHIYLGYAEEKSNYGMSFLRLIIDNKTYVNWNTYDGRRITQGIQWINVENDYVYTTFGIGAAAPAGSSYMALAKISDLD